MSEWNGEVSGVGAVRVIGALLVAAAAGCGHAPPNGNGARTPAGAVASTPAAASPARGRWLLHGSLTASVGVDGVAASYLATWFGAEHVGRTVSLPGAYYVSFSPDGKWLTLCIPDPEGATPHAIRRASVLRLDGESISEPLVVGECGELEWAPTGARLLLRSDDRDWRLVELGGSEPLVRELGARFQSPISWSPNGRYFVAPGRDETQDLLLVSVLERGRPAQVLDGFAESRRACHWSSTDGFACVVVRQGKEQLVIAHVSDVSLAPHVVEPSLPVKWFGWATDRALVYEHERDGGVYVLGADLASMRLFEPAASAGYYSSTMSPRGGWLLDCAGEGARLWDLASAPRRVPLPGLPARLVNPRWSPDGKHALLGVPHRAASLQQDDVWLVADASREPRLARVAKLAPERQSYARFSPASGWVLVSVSTDVPTLAAAARASDPDPAASHFAVHVATLAERPLPFGSAAWAADDSAFVTADDARLLGFRVRGTTIIGPEDLGRLGAPGTTPIWQP
ncbi:MAG TPA: hypothetical protein VEQ58_05235 [Polyangiaceae bacterium]|nr:hypothetical protein [Polyangiaceae bacterium]